METKCLGKEGNVSEMIKGLTIEAIDQLNQAEEFQQGKVPPSYLRLEQLLISLKDQGKVCVSLSDVKKLISSIEGETIERALKLLDQYGTICHFSKSENEKVAEMIFLDPNFLIDLVRPFFCLICF